MKKTALHELLAVETTLSETANRVQKDTTKTLSTKESMFAGMVKAHQIFNEEEQHLTQAPDIKEVQTTATELLDYACGQIGAYWDVTLQKEAANQHATADIIVELWRSSCNTEYTIFTNQTYHQLFYYLWKRNLHQ